MSFQHQLLNVLLRGLVIYAVLGLEFTQAHGQPGSHTTDAASLATTGRQTMTHTNVFTHPFSLPFSPFLSPVGFKEILCAGFPGEKSLHFSGVFLFLLLLLLLYSSASEWNAWRDRNADMSRISYNTSGSVFSGGLPSVTDLSVVGVIPDHMCGFNGERQACVRWQEGQHLGLLSEGRGRKTNKTNCCLLTVASLLGQQVKSAVGQMAYFFSSLSMFVMVFSGTVHFHQHFP